MLAGGELDALMVFLLEHGEYCLLKLWISFGLDIQHVFLRIYIYIQDSLMFRVFWNVCNVVAQDLGFLAKANHHCAEAEIIHYSY